MDKGNLLFYITNGQEGYPAGDFYTAVLDLVFKKRFSRGKNLFRSLPPDEYFERLVTLFGHADTFNLEALKEAFPGVHELLSEYYQGRLMKEVVEGRLYWTLRTIGPLLITALPPLRQAFVELQKQDEAFTAERSL